MPTIEGLTSTRIEELLDLKADLTLLDDFADQTAVDNALALKADATAVTSALALKADTTAVTSGLAGKADASATTASLALKADASAVTSSLAGKANLSGGALAVGEIPSVVMRDTDRVYGMPSPADQNLAAWTIDPMTVNGGKATTSGFIYLSKFVIHRATSITKLHWGIATAGVSPVSSQNWVGIYNSSGVLMTSVDVTSRITTTGLFIETVSSVSLPPGAYWFAYLFNASTPPQPFTGGNTTSALGNVGLTASTYRFAVAGTVRTTLFGSYSVSSNVTTLTAFWGAVAA